MAVPYESYIQEAAAKYRIPPAVLAGLTFIESGFPQPGPQIVRGPFAEDPDLAAQSLDVLASTHAQTVLPGHGEPWPHGVENAVDRGRQPDGEP